MTKNLLNNNNIAHYQKAIHEMLVYENKLRLSLGWNATR